MNTNNCNIKQSWYLVNLMIRGFLSAGFVLIILLLSACMANASTHEGSIPAAEIAAGKVIFGIKLRRPKRLPVFTHA